MFSGLDTAYTNNTHMLEVAKNNFKRFSCVPIMERFNTTSHCLQRLGLFIGDGNKSFNVAGVLNKGEKPINDKYLSDLSRNEYLDALAVNRVDIEFYEWVSKYHEMLFFDDKPPFYTSVN